jgi:hypothetical protein
MSSVESARSAPMFDALQSRWVIALEFAPKSPGSRRTSNQRARFTARKKSGQARFLAHNRA